MKNDQSPIIIVLLLAATLFVAFTTQDDRGSIKGSIKPYNAALNAWAVSDKDTGRGVITNGTFQVTNLNPGRYRVIIEGLRPYRVTTKPDVTVAPRATTDVGEIVLDQ